MSMPKHIQTIVSAIFRKGGATLACQVRDALTENLRNEVTDWMADPEVPEGHTWIRKRLSDNRKVGFVYNRSTVGGRDSYVPDLMGNRKYLGGHPTLEQAQRHCDERLQKKGFIIPG